MEPLWMIFCPTIWTQAKGFGVPVRGKDQSLTPNTVNGKWREEHERRDDAHDTSEDNLQSGNLLFSIYFTFLWLKDYFIA